MGRRLGVGMHREARHQFLDRVRFSKRRFQWLLRFCITARREKCASIATRVAATLGTIVIHGFVVHTIVMALRRNLQRGVLGMRIWVNMTFVMSATLLALVGHLVEIALWAFALDISGAVAVPRA